ncbi:MAG: NAD(P)/FAD-dependent oxidoreductase [Nocardioides sp.]|jgi:cation diffusion facilitator CzcD-associated flavoprotein CzcO|uniref:flavin-containing monooxygenase n=1 Tax=Nocardioides sp. TaxID=35761 RepID=UPI0026347DDA|nr:NAD(P)/FAD-dependent oxidoreductase [Nocardioides sp.]MCW2833405.1 NAD(P)/FAD-dependent oxidoreductase [Nocardioides sp.]
MTQQRTLPATVDHLIVGAGFAGLGMAIRLAEAGEDDFLVIEKDGGVGGTWRANSYPGAACDVPSQLYSFSFAPNPDWSMSFSPQPEIEAYLRTVAEESGTLDRFCFDTELSDARWDEDDQRWHVTTTRGEVISKTLISGSGGLSAPKLPEIEGIETFQGEVFHSARWRHDVDLTGKRVAVIGTGASSIQIVPAIAPDVAHLDVYQRTAPYVMPRNDRRYTRLERLLFKTVPAVQRAYRAGIYLGRELYVPGFVWNPKLMAPAKKIALAHMAKAIDDPELRAKVTPTYEIGCKRILISNTYYPALAADNVDLVTDPIIKVTGDAVVTADGTERPIDVLVVATGFQTTEQPIAEHLYGRGGRSLAEVWAERGMASYKGTTTHGFPNLFQLVGANTGLGHSSMVFIIESQIAYVLDALRTMKTHEYAAIEPRQQAQDEWNANLQSRMKRTVWSAGGCSSWYLDAHGKNTTLWPRSTISFRKLLARFDAEHYDLEPARTTEGARA